MGKWNELLPIDINPFLVDEHPPFDFVGQLQIRKSLQFYFLKNPGLLSHGRQLGALNFLLQFDEVIKTAVQAEIP